GPSGTSPGQSSQYVQYQLTFTGNGSDTPVVQDVTFSAAAPGPPAISVGDVSIVEGNSGTKNAGFQLTLSHASTVDVSVAYATADGTATAGSDYTAVSGTAVFRAGTTTVTVNVPILGDTPVESDETFVLNLSAPTNATVADGQGVATIVNDDSPSLTINNVSVTEG